MQPLLWSRTTKPTGTLRFQPAGMSDQDDWGEDDGIDMGDQLAFADEPPTVKYSHIEGADGRAEVPAPTTHPPDPTHFSMPESSPLTDEVVDVEETVREEDNTETQKEVQESTVDVVIKEEYIKQEEELDYKDDVPTEE